MPKKSEPVLEMANFICKFGDQHNLLDLYSQVIHSAFFGKRTRKFDRTSFFIYQQKIIKLEDGENGPVLGITGRFIKNTFLEREQIFDPSRGIIHDSQEMESAPSAVFLLVLNVHRLLYVKETTGAPSLESFRSTLQTFLKDSHRTFTNNIFEEHKIRRQADPELGRLTKKEILSKYPWPHLEVIPLASEQSLEAFVNKYDLLKSLEIKLVEPNDEIDNEDFFNALRSRKNSINSSRTVLRHTNSGGLDKDETVSQLKAIASQGNQKIKMDGMDEYGDKLTGNNESFKVKTSISSASSDVGGMATAMYRSFVGLVENKVIIVPPVKKHALEKLKEIEEKYMMDNDIKYKFLLDEKSLWQIYVKARLLDESKCSRILTASFVVFLLLVQLLSNQNLNTLREVYSELSWSGFTLAISVLGFLIAGFTIFATVSKPELFLMMADHKNKKSSLPTIKYNFFIFIRVFFNFFVFSVLCLTLKFIGGDGGVIETLYDSLYEGNSAIIIFYKLGLVLLGSIFFVMVLQLKSFVFNIYHSVMTSLVWYGNEERD